MQRSKTDKKEKAEKTLYQKKNNTSTPIEQSKTEIPNLGEEPKITLRDQLGHHLKENYVDNRGTMIGQLKTNPPIPSDGPKKIITLRDKFNTHLKETHVDTSHTLIGKLKENRSDFSQQPTSSIPGEKQTDLDIDALIEESKRIDQSIIETLNSSDEKYKIMEEKLTQISERFDNIKLQMNNVEMLLPEMIKQSEARNTKIIKKKEQDKIEFNKFIKKHTEESKKLDERFKEQSRKHEELMSMLSDPNEKKPQAIERFLRNAEKKSLFSTNCSSNFFPQPSEKTEQQQIETHLQFDQRKLT